MQQCNSNFAASRSSGSGIWFPVAVELIKDNFLIEKQPCYMEDFDEYGFHVNHDGLSGTVFARYMGRHGSGHVTHEKERTMSGKVFKVVAVSGSTSRPSRTLAVTEALLSGLRTQLPVEPHLIELGEIAPVLSGVLSRPDAPAALELQLRAIEEADALIVASPVYRASYTGLFKHLFDLVHHEALIDVPVLLAATGGSERHALMIDHQLRPLFSFFQARTLPIGVYASGRDFHDYAIASPELLARIGLAVERAVPLVREASRFVSPVAAKVA